MLLCLPDPLKHFPNSLAGFRGPASKAKEGGGPDCREKRKGRGVLSMSDTESLHSA